MIPKQPNMSGGDNIIRSTFLRILFGIAIGILSCYMLVLLSCKVNSFKGQYVWVDQFGNGDLNAYTHELIIKGKILAVSDVFGSLVSYYNTLITILLGLLAILSVVVYLYSRGISTEWAERELEKRFQRQMDELENRYAKSLDKQIDDRMSESDEEWDELSTKIERLENDLEELKSGSYQMKRLLEVVNRENSENGHHKE